MHNLEYIEVYFKKYMENISFCLPEDIIHVDLKVLHQLDLLHHHDPDYNDPALTRYFHVIESDDKITLLNDEFIVWIVPDKQNSEPITITMIATNFEGEPDLQLCFITSGVYNTSRLVLRLLEKYLFEIQENEKLLKELANKT